MNYRAIIPLEINNKKNLIRNPCKNDAFLKILQNLQKVKKKIITTTLKINTTRFPCIFDGMVYGMVLCADTG